MSNSRMRSKIMKKTMIKITSKIRTQYVALLGALCPAHNRNHSPNRDHSPNPDLYPAPDRFPLPSPPLTHRTKPKWTGRGQPLTSTRETWAAPLAARKVLHDAA